MKKQLLFLLMVFMAIAFTSAEENDITYSESLVQRAQSGDVIAQNDLGECYYEGYGVEKDLHQAFIWYSKAAEQSNIDAQHSIGLMYVNGEWVQKDIDKALKYFMLAAEQGSGKAQIDLGNLYYDGEEVSQNFEKAAYWYSKAAEQGYAWAQYSIGYMYANGEWVQKDIDKALKYYTLAAEQGIEEAQTKLGDLYYDGEEVSQDFEKAAYWYSKAAEQDDAEAQYGIGLCYMKGQGVEKSQSKAKHWFEKSAQQGNKDAAEQLDKITAEIKKKEIAEAALKTFLKTATGHTYSCNNFDAGGNAQALWIVSNVTTTQSVKFVSKNQVVLTTRVTLGSREAQNSPLAHEYKQWAESHLSGTMKVEYKEGYILLYNNEGKFVNGFEPHGTGKLKDAHGNVFTKVK